MLFRRIAPEKVVIRPWGGGRRGASARPEPRAVARDWTDVFGRRGTLRRMGIQQHAVTPSGDFYRLYSAAQVDVIVDSLSHRAEFPYQLTYLGDGSELWREREVASNPDLAPMLGDFDTLLTRHAEQLLALVPSSPPVQIIDLGPGTTRPVRGLIRHLLDSTRLAGYRALDISAEILELARENLRADFPAHVESFELCRGDFTGPDLARVLTAEHSPGHDGTDPVRFVVLAGATLYNFAEPAEVLCHVRRFMSDADVLLLTLRIDTGVDRPPFMDQVSVGGPYKPQQLAGLDLLAIDRSWYVTETGFDRMRSEVFVRARFLEPVAVTFDGEQGHRTVSFEPGDTVLVWRYLYHDSTAVADQLTHCGLQVRLFEHGQDRQAVLVAATPAH
ncbi:L-histidine N(alpha)-methyltransferase [Streptomyces sp. NPDC048506]|uniref:L-histidine N(alpha)-methyltransferase n=1 Tax=Streptomyces sp. NPDC048506 TaxID=3155028 RepID=UPI00341A5653